VERQFVELFSEICASGPPGPDNPALAEATLAPAGTATKAPPRPATKAQSRTATKAQRRAAAGTERGSSWWRRLFQRLFGGRK
jgi:hypothetical protein